MEVDLISLQLGFLLISVVAFQLCASSQPVYSEFGRKSLISTEEVNNTAICPAGWIANQNTTKCFRYLRSLKAWDDAETYCEGYQGNLATLASTFDVGMLFIKLVHELLRTQPITTSEEPLRKCNFSTGRTQQC